MAVERQVFGEGEAEVQFSPIKLTPPTYPSYFGEFKTRIHELAENPQAGDQMMGAFYKGLSDLIATDFTAAAFFNEAMAAKADRNDLTVTHFANLSLRAFQAIHLERDGYPYGTDSAKWGEALQHTLAEAVDKDRLREYLVNRDTNTTLYERYAGPKAMLSAFLPPNEFGINVADFGCGGNFGLPGIAIGEQFTSFVDHTPDTTLARFMAKTLVFQNAVAVDQNDPYDPEMIAWRRACSVYPQEVGKLPAIIQFEEKLAEQKYGGVKFIQADLRDLDGQYIDHGTLDAVIMSTMCYQLTPEDQASLLESTKALLKPTGIIVVQDFAKISEENPHLLDTNVSWSTPFSYRTFVSSAETSWRMKEILQWKTGRCAEVRAGQDFDLLESRLDTLPYLRRTTEKE